MTRRAVAALVARYAGRCAVCGAASAGGVGSDRACRACLRERPDDVAENVSHAGRRAARAALRPRRGSLPA